MTKRNDIFKVTFFSPLTNFIAKLNVFILCDNIIIKLILFCAVESPLSLELYS